LIGSKRKTRRLGTASQIRLRRLFAVGFAAIE
jgi:hypothetical protein